MTPEKKYLQEQLASVVMMEDFYSNHLADDKARLSVDREELAAVMTLIEIFAPGELNCEEVKLLEEKKQSLRDSIASLESDVIPGDEESLRHYQNSAKVFRNLLAKLKAGE